MPHDAIRGGRARDDRRVQRVIDVGNRSRVVRGSGNSRRGHRERLSRRVGQAKIRHARRVTGRGVGHHEVVAPRSAGREVREIKHKRAVARRRGAVEREAAALTLQGTRREISRRRGRAGGRHPEAHAQVGAKFVVQRELREEPRGLRGKPGEIIRGVVPPRCAAGPERTGRAIGLSGRGPRDRTRRAQRVVGEPHEAVVLPVAAPRVADFHRALFTGIDHAVLVDVDPEIVVVAHHGHRVATALPLDETHRALPDESIIRRRARVIADVDVLPAVNIRRVEQRITIGQQSLQILQARGRVDVFHRARVTHAGVHRVAPHRRAARPLAVTAGRFDAAVRPVRPGRAPMLAQHLDRFGEPRALILPLVDHRVGPLRRELGRVVLVLVVPPARQSEHVGADIIRGGKRRAGTDAPLTAHRRKRRQQTVVHRRGQRPAIADRLRLQPAPRPHLGSVRHGV